MNACKHLDQLGMTSTFNHKVFCRQAFIGGNYGLHNTSSFIPKNPDYYGSEQTNSGGSNNSITARGGYYGSDRGTYHDRSSDSNDYREFGYYHHYGQPQMPIFNLLYILILHR
ncbi:hypothetical protein LguiB_016047 [Lonicera macranthoides]